MAYKDSDYTVVITIMQWPKRTILVLKLTLVVEIQALLSRRGRHCSCNLSDFGGSTVLSRGTRRFWPHGRDRCRSLTLTCQNSPCWQSCKCCNNFVSSLRPPLLAIDRAWLPRGMCVNWNYLRYFRYGESQPALERLPGVRLPLVTLLVTLLV